MVEQTKPEPLAVTCTSTDCENNLHCFLQSKEMAPEQRGTCRECGANLIDWSCVHRRDPNDAEHTFAQLRFEMIRHHFFHKPFDQKAINHARRKGRILLREAIEARLSNYLAPAQISFGRMITPYNGNTIYYGQHATATCCRKCLEYWHGIPMGVELTSEQLDYCVKLVELYLDLRLPDLNEHPVVVPPIRKTAASEQQKAPTTIVQASTLLSR